jgi:hypothetical protein
MDFINPRIDGRLERGIVAKRRHTPDKLDQVWRFFLIG